MTEPAENIENHDVQVPKDWIPVIVWSNHFYKQQKEFILSDSWQTWFIAGNGTGKTLTLYWTLVAFMLGLHPKQVAPPPIKIKCLVPSFDNVIDVALAKLLDDQTITFKQNGNVEHIRIGPLLPKSMIVPKKSYTKDHKGIELKNGSSLWWATSEQGWMFHRGGEQDVLGLDEESDHRVFDECVRGLRNAKGGGRIVAGLTPPYQLGQGPTWTKEKVLEASVNDPDIHVVHACMADNPSITPQFIERFSKGKTKKQIDVQVYGKYPTWGDLVHPDFQDTLWDPKKMTGHLLPNDTPMPENYDVDWIMAFDWHQSKPCAAIFGFVTSDGNITIFDELDKDVAENKEIDELADLFFSIEGTPHLKRRFRRWQDPSTKSKYQAVQRGFNAWDAFRKVGIITSAGKNRDPDVGISIVNDYFKGNGRDHPRVFIYERCRYLRQYLGNHFWKRGEDGKGKPDPKWSDYPICLRYILQELGWKTKRGPRKQWPLTSYQKVDDGRKVIDISRIM